MSRRSELRAQVFEIAGDQCEHPSIGLSMIITRCETPATELAHIFPRGMGHTGYRDRLDNVMAACPVHARSTDDLSSPEWEAVDALLGTWEQVQLDGALIGRAFVYRVALEQYVDKRRRLEGVDLERSDR